MKCSLPTLTGLFLTGFLILALPAQRAQGQESQDNKAHIQPRSTPTPTPTPATKGSQPSPTPQDEYERPPFPGDAPGTRPTSKSPDSDERPPFPGDAPGTSPTGESSSRDSQINLKARPGKEDVAPLPEDETVLTPWDPHKAAKDVEVGQWYLKMKNYRAALERFNHALTYKPDDAEAIYGLAVTQEKLDLLALADQSYRKYLQILPHGPKAKEAEEGLKRIAPNVAANKAAAPVDVARMAAHDIDVGETYLSGNNFDAARERFEDALRLTPDNPLIWFRLGQALQGMQRLEPARLYYKKYLEAEPKGKFAGNAKKAVGEIDWLLGK